MKFINAVFDLDNLIKFLSGKLYVPFMGIFYVIAKIIAKYYTHKLILNDNEKLDLWPVIAWFAVDLAVLSLALSLTLNIPQQKGLDQTIWYMVLGLSIFLSCFLYGHFMKLRKRPNNSYSFRRLRLSLLLCFSYLPGGAFFKNIIEFLLK